MPFTILLRMLRQQACYFAPSAQADKFGKLTFSPPIPVTVRWEDTVTEHMGKDGRVWLSKSRIYVDQTTNFQVGGFMFLGTITDLVDQSNPINNPDCYEIKKFSNTPTFDATQALRIAYL